MKNKITFSVGAENNNETINLLIKSQKDFSELVNNNEDIKFHNVEFVYIKLNNDNHDYDFEQNYLIDTLNAALSEINKNLYFNFLYTILFDLELMDEFNSDRNVNDIIDIIKTFKTS